MREARKDSVYHLTMISGIKNKFIRRFLMVLMAPVLFMINVVLTVVVTIFMCLIISIGTTMRNTVVLGRSIKEKW